MKRLAAFLFIFACTLNAQNERTSLQLDIDLLLKDPYFKTASISVDIYDLTDREILYRKNEEKLFHPASNMKVITTVAGLLFLGEKYKYETGLVTDGTINNGILNGDLYVVGGFDPDFTTHDLDSLVQDLKDKGITKITGSLYGDVSKIDTLRWGQGWMWDDDPFTDFPYMTSLNINDNAVKLAFEPGEIGSPVNIEIIPETNYFNDVYGVINTSVTIEEDTSDFTLTRDWMNFSNNIIVDGTLSQTVERDTIEVNLVEPEKYFLYLMKESLAKHGIEFNGTTGIEQAPEDAELITKFSRPFILTLHNLNKTSDNLSAEMTLRAMAYEHFDEPASAHNGVVMIDSAITLAGLDADVYRIVDGSGVSHYNLVSAELLTDLMKFMYYEHLPLYKHMHYSFPIAGVDGTLKYRMKETGAYNNVRAKTGTLSGVSCLAGQLTAANGHHIMFTVMVQNYKGSSRTARGFQDEICRILSEWDD